MRRGSRTIFKTHVVPCNFEYRVQKWSPDSKSTHYLAAAANKCPTAALDHAMALEASTPDRTTN